MIIYAPVNSKTAYMHAPRAIPWHLTRIKLRTMGNFTQMRPARWGIWLPCQNVCQRSETKGFRNSLIQHVSCVDGSLLLSIPRGFFCCCRFIQLYREICLCLKHGAKTSWTRILCGWKFCRTCFQWWAILFISKGKRFCFPWRVGSLRKQPSFATRARAGSEEGRLFSQARGWGIWPSLKLSRVAHLTF